MNILWNLSGDTHWTQPVSQTIWIKTGYFAIFDPRHNMVSSFRILSELFAFGISSQQPLRLGSEARPWNRGYWHMGPEPFLKAPSQELNFNKFLTLDAFGCLWNKGMQRASIFYDRWYTVLRICESCQFAFERSCSILSAVPCDLSLL